MPPTAAISPLSALTAPDRAAVLRDERLDRRLSRDGFVVLPLLDADGVARLRHAYDDLGAPITSGFASDLVSEDREYRAQADGVIAEHLDVATSALFEDHRPFLHSFLVKHPGQESGLYLHQDWMYIDERSGERTHVAWVALEDITGHNGQLRVLRGSHRLDRSLRGTALTAPWLGHVASIERRLLSIPVPSGHCVIFDNALVHCSYPNNTDRPRVAVAVGLRPAGVPLVHFRRVDEHTAVRFEVDESFFLTHTPQGLLASGPDLSEAEVVRLDPNDLTSAELERRMDALPLARLDRVEHHVHRARARASSHAKNAADAIRGSVRRRPASDDVGRDRRVMARMPSILRPGAAGVDRAVKPDSADSLVRRIRGHLDDLPTKAAIAVLGLNEASINRFGPANPAVWDPSQFRWAERIEAGYADIRAEVEALLVGSTEIPLIEDVTGGIPQGNIGPWRSFVLMHQGHWMEWNCARCPRTTELVRTIPGLTVAGFSVLEPGTRITEHRGPNKGALRYQLGVVVPGAYGDCRIRVGEEMLVWQEGEGVMFDFTFPHEAWNDSDGIRVLLMLEVVTPGLPWYLAHTNRLAQRAMGWFPTTRDMTRRLRTLEPSLRRTGSGVPH